MKRLKLTTRCTIDRATGKRLAITRRSEVTVERINTKAEGMDGMLHDQKCFLYAGWQLGGRLQYPEGTHSLCCVALCAWKLVI